MPRSKSVPFFLHVASDRRVRLAVSRRPINATLEECAFLAFVESGILPDKYRFPLPICPATSNLPANLMAGLPTLIATCIFFSEEPLPHNLVLQFRSTTPSQLGTRFYLFLF
jgi:hypothetical protein